MKIRRQIEDQKIKDLYQLTSKIADEETQAHMSKYLCVQSSGYLENVVKSLVEDYINKSCPSPVVNYVQKKVNNVTNLGFEKLCDFLDSFDPSWKDSFCQSINDEQKSALNSIISNRNAIAHGNISNITYRSMSVYFSELNHVVSILEKIIKK
jgi:hypothetical protein